jgi:alkylation response protein AidB-like acyl-CoA dehydrogenase
VAYAEENVLSLETTNRYQTSARLTDDGGWMLSGVKLFVANARTAGLLLVVSKVAGAGHDGQVAMFAVPGGSAGLRVTPMATFGHDAQDVVSFDNVVIGGDALVAGPMSEGEWLGWFGGVNDRVTALQCMEMLGGAERVLEDTVAYIKERHVFGRPIGSFQAAQHHVANLGIALAAARVASYKALCDAAGEGDARRSVSIAKSWLDKAYKDATILAHQLFGAIGYVRETDLHLWSQRAKTTEQTFGDRSVHLARLADLTFGAVGCG